MRKLIDTEKERIKTTLKENNTITKDVLEDTDSFTNDWGLDSIDVVELIIDVEQEFNIIIPDNETEDLDNLVDLYKIIENLID